MTGLPLVDVSALCDPDATAESCATVGREIDAACRDTGFLLVTGHGVDRALRDDLERLSREFFALPDATKAQIAMTRGGLAWRGWFPVGGELTSGQPDRKEGVYFGTELPPTDPRVAAGTPLHGPNLFPAEPAELAPDGAATGSSRWPRSARRCWAASPSASAWIATGSRGT